MSDREKAAARKRRQRDRQKSAGIRTIELILTAEEWEMLNQNRVARRPGREPYSLMEYIQMLIIQDNDHLRRQLAEMEKRQCPRCGDPLPGDSAGCILRGERACWQTNGHRELALGIQLKTL